MPWLGSLVLVDPTVDTPVPVAETTIAGMDRSVPAIIYTFVCI